MPTHDQIMLQLKHHRREIVRIRKEFTDLLFPGGFRREITPELKIELDGLARPHAAHKRSVAILQDMLNTAAPDAATREKSS